MAPLVSHLYDLGYIEARAYPQAAVFEAGLFFARTEGIIPAPEAAHAVKAVIDLALEARTRNENPSFFSISAGTACWTSMPTMTTCKAD